MGSKMYENGDLQTIAKIFTFVDPFLSHFTAEPFLAMSAAKAQAKAVENQARAVESEAKYTAEQLRKENLVNSSAEQLAFARSGVYSNTGAPLEVLTSNAVQRELSALSVELRGLNEVNALKAQKKNILLEAKFAVSKAAQQSGKRAVGVILGGYLGGASGAAAGNAIGGQGAGDLGAGASTLFSSGTFSRSSGAGVNK